jgi:hypothetical protein
MTLEEIQRLLQSAGIPLATRIVFLTASIALAVVVLRLVRRRALGEEFTPLWLAVAASTIVLSASERLLVSLTHWLGAWTPSSTLFFLGVLVLGGLSLHYAVRLSRLSLQVKSLAQEVALLRPLPPR